MFSTDRAAFAGWDEAPASSSKLSSTAEMPSVHHEWLIYQSHNLPCGCETVAKAALIDLPGTHAEVMRLTARSVRSALHRAFCARCGECMLIVENRSQRPRWKAQAFLQSATGAWTKADMPPQIVCALGFNPHRVQVAHPTGVCNDTSHLHGHTSLQHGHASPNARAGAALSHNETYSG